MTHHHRSRPRPLRSLVLTTLGCGVAVVAACASAQAAFGPGATPASLRGIELGDRASGGAQFSGNGRYVVFSTESSVLLGTPADAAEYFSRGWVRKDLQSGSVELVATPERRLRRDGSLVAASVAGEVAGISDDGRYILFDSIVPLVDSAQSTVTPEVYVRDMTRPRSDSSGYELVSAENGSDSPPRYDDRRAGSKPGLTGFSLSDDGRRALFVTQTGSSLPEGGALPATPRWQIFVRDLDARTTRLVTRDRSDSTLPGTPVVPSAGASAPRPMLSGDGGAVAWVGSDPQRQARFLTGESANASGSHVLWRDLRAGPAEPARRVAGEADPDDPGCPPDAVFVPAVRATGPCYGPFAAPEELTTSQPAPPTLRGISDDGRRVLFSSSGWLRPYEGVDQGERGFLVDMAPGISRKQAVGVAWAQPLSRLPILNATLAGDGRHAAFISADSQFGGLQPIGTFQTGELLTPNVFAVDLAARTVERATVAVGGGDFQLAERTGGSTAVTGVSSSDDGAAIAFAAADGNLFLGDANGVRDVQVVSRQVDQRGTGGSSRQLPPAPAPPHVVESPLTPLLPVHATIGRVRVDRRGVATVTVRVPAPGTLVAEATGRRIARGARAGARVNVGRDRHAPRRASRVTLRITPSRTARRELSRAPHRMRVALRIRYAAPSGSSRSDQVYTLSRRAPATKAPRATRPKAAG